ncbi:MAG: peroxiredoxin [Gammaproteobacteria bacterium]|nr:peroxiredoxin [Gammaproteobacteria bacterium]
MARKRKRNYHELHLNELAPDFEVATISGVIRLSDYRGRWVVLFSHPADFTPVCTSEIVRLAELYQQFRALNCEIIGLSVDSQYTHVAWLDAIRKSCGIKVPFPIIDDQGRKIANKYGMIHPDSSTTCTVRSTFIIDDEGRLRMLQHYPIWVGRSLDEILRVLQAAQTSDREGVALPESWHPGDAAVDLPAEPLAASKNSLSEWFSSIKKDVFARHH